VLFFHSYPLILAFIDKAKRFCGSGGLRPHGLRLVQDVANHGSFRCGVYEFFEVTQLDDEATCAAVRHFVIMRVAHDHPSINAFGPPITAGVRLFPPIDGASRFVLICDYTGKEVVG